MGVRCERKALDIGFPSSARPGFGLFVEIESRMKGQKAFDRNEAPMGKGTCSQSIKQTSQN